MEEQQEQSKPRLNRLQLQGLAERYVIDAENLLMSRRWSSAYYLAGYAIECALKACIAKEVRQHDFPDYRIVREFYTHDLRQLLKLAGLKGPLGERASESVGFYDNWFRIVVGWNESSRYENPTQDMAEDMFRAVSNSEEGVLPWLRRYW